MSNNQLNDISKTYLEAVYGGGKKKEAPKDNRLVVTAADKKANTKAYQNYKAGNKAYKAADHLKDDYEFARHKASIISRGGRLEDAVESWNQKLAYREAMKEVSEKKEVNVKDTYKTVAAIVDYDRAKKGSEYATYDSEHGKKKEAKKERDYAAWERSKMKKDDPNWKHKKYHTGMHGEDKDWGYDSKGRSLNPADIEARKKEDDDLFGSPNKKGKKAKKDYDGDGKIESGKAEYFGSKDKAIKKAMAKEEVVQEEGIADILARLEKKRISKGGDPEESPLPAMRKYHADKKKKVKKESLSDWRTDLSDLIEIVAEPESKAEKEVVEKKVKNKVIINPKLNEVVEEMGGELIEMVDIVEEYEPEIEAATEYFYAEGINEEGLDAIIEEVGLDEFVDFVIDSAQDLNEERAARKMSARNLQTLKKKTIPAAKEADAKRKKDGKGEYSAAYKKKETDVTVYDDKPKAKAKPKAKPIAVKKPAAKKVAAVTKQVKKLQPAKKASKQGIGDKIRGAIKKGVARHQAARAKGREPEKRVKEFGKGFASGVKGAVKFAGKVKKVVSEEGKVKKEIGYLSKAVKTMKGKDVAKADKVEEAMTAYEKARKAAARRAADRNAARRRGELGGRMERETYTSEGGKRMHYKGYTARDGE